MVKLDPAATGITKVVLGPCHDRAFTAVMTGPERTPTDNATAPSSRVGTRAAVGRSALGLHGIGNRWSSAGTNGHRRYARIPRSQPIHIYGVGRWTGEAEASNPTSRSGVLGRVGP
jgi:hypothetical protein